MDLDSKKHLKEKKTKQVLRRSQICTRHRNGSKSYQERFRVEIRKDFSTKRVLKHWNRILREAANSPIVTI